MQFAGLFQNPSNSNSTTENCASFCHEKKFCDQWSLSHLQNPATLNTLFWRSVGISAHTKPLRHSSYVSSADFVLTTFPTKKIWPTITNTIPTIIPTIPPNQNHRGPPNFSPPPPPPKKKNATTTGKIHFQPPQKKQPSFGANMGRFLKSSCRTITACSRGVANKASIKACTWRVSRGA